MQTKNTKKSNVKIALMVALISVITLINIFNISSVSANTSSTMVHFTTLSSGSLNITDLTVNPDPATYNQEELDIEINFTSNKYPLTINFNLNKDGTGTINEQGPIQIASSTDLPVIYTIPADLDERDYTIHMTITREITAETLSFEIGSFTIQEDDKDEDDDDNDGDYYEDKDKEEDDEKEDDFRKEKKQPEEETQDNYIPRSMERVLQENLLITLNQPSKPEESTPINHWILILIVLIILILIAIFAIYYSI